MDYFTFYTNRAKKANNAVQRTRFLKLAEKYRPQVQSVVEDNEPECVEACQIDDKPKRGRKPKVQKEEGA